MDRLNQYVDIESLVDSVEASVMEAKRKGNVSLLENLSELLSNEILKENLSETVLAELENPCSKYISDVPDNIEIDELIRSAQNYRELGKGMYEIYKKCYGESLEISEEEVIGIAKNSKRFVDEYLL